MDYNCIHVYFHIVTTRLLHEFVIFANVEHYTLC